MKHASFEAGCGVCQSLAGDAPIAPLYEGEVERISEAYRQALRASPQR